MSKKAKKEPSFVTVKDKKEAQSFYLKMRYAGRSPMRKTVDGVIHIVLDCGTAAGKKRAIDFIAKLKGGVI